SSRTRTTVSGRTWIRSRTRSRSTTWSRAARRRGVFGSNEWSSARAMTRLKAGDWVEVRSREEILATLDSRGQLDNMPFMPEMFEFCGKRFEVWSRAHKTCDTVTKTGGRWLPDTVHLKDLRCDGKGHGGCDAGCLLFWKEAWLRPLEGKGAPKHSVANGA